MKIVKVREAIEAGVSTFNIKYYSEIEALFLVENYYDRAIRGWYVEPKDSGFQLVKCPNSKRKQTVHRIPKNLIIDDYIKSMNK